MTRNDDDLDRPADRAEVDATREAKHSEPAWEDLDAATWHEIALTLVEVDEHQLYRAEGWRCRDTAHYAELDYCLPRAVTEELLRIGRKLRELPLLERLLAAGRLSWRHVVLLTRVAVPRYERAWARRACLVPFEQLELLVERSAHGWAPPDVGDPSAGAAALDAIVAALGESPCSGAKGQRGEGRAWPDAALRRLEAIRRRSRGACRRRVGALQRMAVGARERRPGAPEGGARRRREAPNVRRSGGAPPPSG